MICLPLFSVLFFKFVADRYRFLENYVFHIISSIGYDCSLLTIYLSACIDDEPLVVLLLLKFQACNVRLYMKSNGIGMYV